MLLYEEVLQCCEPDYEGYWLIGFLDTNTTSTIIIVYFMVNFHTGATKLHSKYFYFKRIDNL